MTPKNYRLPIGIALLSLLLFSSCKKDHSPMHEPDNKVLKGMSFYALTRSNELVKFSPGFFDLYESGSVAITGLQSMEKVLAIDFRPATGQLYGVSDQSRLYVINQTTGVAVAVSATPFSPAIDGMEVGFDFNPTVDRIRLVTSNDQNIRLNPETGLLAAADVAINPSAASITAVAYTNSMAGAATTTLYDIDAASDKLFKQIPPNNGTLVEVGPLQVQISGEAGFDIAPDSSIAIAAFYTGGNEKSEVINGEEKNNKKYGFYHINLSTGKATEVGKTTREIIGLAIPTNPVAYAVDQANNLLIFNPEKSTGMVIKAIGGLPVGEMIVGIDMRPATAQLYALSSASKLYTINMSSGAALAVAAAPFTPALSGTSFGFDFNPTVDRIRVVSNTGQNLRLHPVLGTVAATDPVLNPGSPSVDAAGYINSFAGSTITTLYDVDYVADMLYTQNPANAGTLIAVGALGINASAGNGFDIGGTTNKAWGIFTVGGTSGLYSIDLSTGKAKKKMPFGTNVNGFAIGLGF